MKAEFLKIFFKAEDASQMTPLHMACSHGQVGVAEALIDCKADLQSVGEKRQTCLHKAAAIGNVDLVRMITNAAQAQGSDVLLKVS